MNVSYDVNQLLTYIDLPITPQQVTWQIVPASDASVPGPNKTLLFAVVSLSQEQFHDVRAGLRPLHETVGLHENWVQAWFPKPLLESLTPASLPGYKKIGLSSYEAIMFVKTSSPYRNGFVVLIEEKFEIFIMLNTAA